MARPQSTLRSLGQGRERGAVDVALLQFAGYRHAWAFGSAVQKEVRGALESHSGRRRKVWHTRVEHHRPQRGTGRMATFAHAPQQSPSLVTKHSTPRQFLPIRVLWVCSTSEQSVVVWQNPHPWVHRSRTDPVEAEACRSKENSCNMRLNA